MSEPLTSEEIRWLKSQVYPGATRESWEDVVGTVLHLPAGLAKHEALRALYDDAKRREAERPKEPPIPPGPEGVDAGVWKESVACLREIAGDYTGNVCLDPVEAAHILAALEAYRPGEEMVPIEAFVKCAGYDNPYPWASVHDSFWHSHKTKDEALAAVRESVRKALKERGE